jgi:hypothetical protein
MERLGSKRKGSILPANAPLSGMMESGSITKRYKISLATGPKWPCRVAFMRYLKFLS